MRKQHYINASRGSALMMAMIFLLVLTVAGITAMRFANMEESMAANSQASGYVFQQAQSEIWTHLNYFGTLSGLNRLNALDYEVLPKETDTNLLKVLPATASEEKDLAAVPDTDIAAIKDDRKIRFIRDGHCADGSSIGQFICIEFEMEIEADVANGARTRQVQGFTFRNNVSDGN